MGVAALIIAIFLYLITAYDFYSKNNLPLCWVFICYALANLGFLAAVIKDGSCLLYTSPSPRDQRESGVGGWGG